MKQQMQKIMYLLGIGCLSSVLAAGCGSKPAVVPSDNQAVEMPLSADSGNTEHSEAAAIPNIANTESAETAAGATESGAENTDEKWHILPPEVAAIVDADFEGEIWKIDKDRFYILEITTEILDDGSLLTCSPSPDVDIPDSALIPVVFDEAAHFYMRTIHGNSESYEDAEASFQDLEEHLTVEMKGSFESDVFHADEIRIVKVV